MKIAAILFGLLAVAFVGAVFAVEVPQAAEVPEGVHDTKGKGEGEDPAVVSEHFAAAHHRGGRDGRRDSNSHDNDWNGDGNRHGRHHHKSDSHEHGRHGHRHSKSDSHSKSHSHEHGHRHSKSNSHEHGRHDRSDSHEHDHHHHNHVCSVQSDYWLAGINERRVCRNTANGSTGDCKSCCVAAYMQDHEGENGENVVGFISTNPKDADQRQCVCCSPQKRHCRKLKELSRQQLDQYGHVFDNSTDAFGPGTAKVADADFKRTDDGLVATCQCKKNIGRWCWLEFANGFDSFLKNHTIPIWNERRSDGGFDKLTSAPITCQNGLNYINGTKVTHFACYSWIPKNEA